MAKLLTALVIIVKVLGLSNGQKGQYWSDNGEFDHLSYPNNEEENPHSIHSYDQKNQTEQGYYKAEEPADYMRPVKFSSELNTGFAVTVNRDDFLAQPIDKKYGIEEKALRDYERNYDFSEDADIESSYTSIGRKRHRHPYESLFKDYSLSSKRPKYPLDMEPSEYTHSFSINHQRDDLHADASAHSHVGVSFDPNCNTKNKKQKHKYYSHGADLDFRKQKYPTLTSDSYDSDYDKYVGEPSNIEIEKLIHMYKQNDRYKTFKPDESSSWSSTKNGYPGIFDLPNSEDSYSDYIPPRPKKKHKPQKIKDLYESEDLDDYILVPKKKLKKPPRTTEQYHPDAEEEFDEIFEEDRFHKPPRGTHTEVIRKIVKKKKPVINILDIFDI